MTSRFLLLAATALLLATACSRPSTPQVETPRVDAQTESTAEETTITTQPAGTGETIDLKIKPQVGQQYRMEMFKDQISEVTIMGQLIPTRRVEVIEGTWEILDTEVFRDFFNARFTFDRTRFAEFSNKGNVGYDSAVDDSPPDHERALIFAGFVGDHIDVTITPSGRIVDVRETDELRQRILDSFPEDLVLNDPQAVERIRQEALTDEAFSLLLENFLTTLPGGPYRIGAEWTEIRRLDDLRSLNDRTIRIVERRDNAITVRRHSVMKPAREGGTMGRRVSDFLAFEIKSGIADTTATVDFDTGWVRQATTTTETHTDLIMRAMQVSDLPPPPMITREKLTVRLLGDGVEPTRNIEVDQSVQPQ